MDTFLHHPLAHEQSKTRLNQIHALLQCPLPASLLATHPNDLDLERDIPSEWVWWTTYGSEFVDSDVNKGDDQQEWIELVRYYNGAGTGTAYAELNKLVDQIKALELPRDPISISTSSFAQNGQTKGKQSSYGMSPKKTHEVLRMSAFVASLLPLSSSASSDGNATRISRPRVVDIGAGQGYLTRALASLPCRPQLLALDGDAAQTVGAERWESRAQKRTPVAEEKNGEIKPDTKAITHKTIHITPETLLNIVDNWIPQGEDDEVACVALHACGSLTPSILRAILQGMGCSALSEGQEGGEGRSTRAWRMCGAVVVGCCYNLMDSSDFPLSEALKLNHAQSLPLAHRHLAAQIPGTWLQLKDGQLHLKQDTKLAIRKVVWRAILGQMIASPPSQPTMHPISKPVEAEPRLYPRRPITEESKGSKGTGETPTHARLGKINDKHYASWDAFLSAAGDKMGIDFSSLSFASLPEWGEQHRRRMETRLATLHVLRCLLGPLVESLILLDRLVWVREELEAAGEVGFEADLVNLFDQETGSGRNVAIVIRPKEARDIVDLTCVY